MLELGVVKEAKKKMEERIRASCGARDGFRELLIEILLLRPLLGIAQAPCLVALGATLDLGFPALLEAVVVLG